MLNTLFHIIKKLRLNKQISGIKMPQKLSVLKKKPQVSFCISVEQQVVIIIYINFYISIMKLTDKKKDRQLLLQMF